jgi:hypothetical protein
VQLEGNFFREKEGGTEKERERGGRGERDFFTIWRGNLR